MTHASERLHRAYIGLGANLDSPARQLKAALEALAAMPALEVVACSSLYASSPVGVIEQPDFINAVALIETPHSPHELLAVLLEAERAAGRVRKERFGPRTLDIDILLFDDLQLDDPALTVPHPRMHERAFVLKPLLELAPDVLIPGRGPAVKWLETVADQRCERHD